MKLITKIKAERMQEHLATKKIYYDQIDEQTLNKINRLEGMFIDEAEILLAKIYDEIHGEVKK